MRNFLLGVWVGSGVVIGSVLAEEQTDDRMKTIAMGYGFFWPVSIAYFKIKDRLG